MGETGRKAKKVVKKAQKSGFNTINSIIDELLPCIATNFTLNEILSYASDYSKYSIVDTTGFPFEKGSGNIPGKGDCVYPITLEKNVIKLHEFLYPDEDYKPTTTLMNISNEIEFKFGVEEKTLPEDN